MAYAELAARIVSTGVLPDPWLDGKPRFATAPLLLDAATFGQLSAAAEAMCALHEEAVRLCRAEPAIVDRFYAWSPWQRRMWESCGGAWHGLARADVFLTSDGPRVCELNSDTPSGEAEAVLLNRLVADHVGAGHVDPNSGFEEAFVSMVEAVAPRRRPLTVGILYPTEIVEDLSMVRIYRQWLSARGAEVVLGSPFNLHAVAGRPGLFGKACDVFIRHYKTDWWSEREPAWLDEPAPPDAAPLEKPLKLLLDGATAGQCAVVNPFGAVLTQNKRTMALLWEEIDRLPPWAAEAVRAYVPHTVRLEAAPPEVATQRADWVLKSDYGCEGAEVLIGAREPELDWAAALRAANPRRFVAQRRFDPLTDGNGDSVNFGVYVAGGQTCGIYSRAQRGATDNRALTTPTFVQNQVGP
jgi:glutathionylspermidine synthase